MTKAGRNVVGVMLVTILSACSHAIAAIESEPVDTSQETVTTMMRIRTADPGIARAIAQATEWSATFRRLVESIQRTDGIVWVIRGRCAHGALACLMVHLVVAGPNRLLQIHVDPRQVGDKLMESLGHELQHVVGILGSGARSTAEMYHFFEYAPEVYRVGERFETTEALKAGFAVGREVARAPR